MYLKSGPTNPPAWLDLSNTACSLLVTVFILSLKRLPIQVFYAGTWEIIAVWDSRSPKSQLVWVTAHKQELLNCWSNYQEPGQISTGECDTWNSLQKMTVGTKSWPKFKRKPTNFMKEKSISRWEIAPYQNSKAWKTLGQVSPKDVPVYHTPYGFICWLINWLMVLRKLSCHSSLWPLLCEGLVQGHSLSPGAASILPTQEQPGVAHWATCTKCIPHQWTGCRLPAIWVWPCMHKDHLDQVCFLYWPICVPIKCGLFTTAVLSAHMILSYASLKPKKTHVKQRVAWTYVNTPNYSQKTRTVAKLPTSPHKCDLK